MKIYRSSWPNLCLKAAESSQGLLAPKLPRQRHADSSLQGTVVELVIAHVLPEVTRRQLTQAMACRSLPALPGHFAEAHGTHA